MGTLRKSILLACILLATISVGAPKKNPGKQKIKTMGTPQKQGPPKQEPKAVEPPSKPFFVNASFGVSRWEGIGFFSGAGFGVFPEWGEKIGWGIEGQLLLVSTGSLFTTLGGAWYYFNHPSLSQRFASLGLLVGAGFAGGGLPLSQTVSAGFFEISGNQRVSDYGWLRFWTRAGLLDGKGAAQLGFSLLFQLK